MEQKMFCYQCEQTVGCSACTGAAGVCGKKADTAKLQDKLTGALIGLARALDGDPGLATAQTNELVIESLFMTLTNVNFDNDSIQAQIDRVHREQSGLVPQCAACASPCGKNEDYDMNQLWQAEENGELVCSVYGADEGAPMNADVMTALGSNITVDYDPSASYGFWVPPEELPTASDDMKQDTWDSIDTFDGAHLTVEATFLDGKTESRTYTLSTGRLRLDRYENGTWTVLPQLAGDEEAYVYGIYAVSEEESRWFQWPVEGSNTISLSNPFGARWNPGGQGKTVHNGIDIPAERGTPVLAAADGTVTETGFDTERGNYLMIDHGDGLATLYAACSKVDVNEGDPVKAGTPIAAVGSTGRSTGPHLHFEVRQDGVPQNPTVYFDADVRSTLRMG